MIYLLLICFGLFMSLFIIGTKGGKFGKERTVSKTSLYTYHRILKRTVNHGANIPNTDNNK